MVDEVLNLIKPKAQGSEFLADFDLNLQFAKLKEIYCVNDISDERKEYLSKTIQKYGYLPYPHYKTLEELSASEIIFAFCEKLKLEGTYDGEKFGSFSNPSALARRKVKHSNWFKKEGHNIKLLSLAGLGKDSEKAGKFIDWLAFVLSLDRGNLDLNIMPSTLYLIPFHPREFECAYLPKSSDVSKNLEDEKIAKFLGLDAKKQVQFFITLTQLAGHPVIYDVLPQTGRFSKIVLTKPHVARWLDLKELDKQISEFKKALKANKSETYDEDLKEYKILISYKMSFKDKQEELVKRVEDIIEKVNGKKPKGEEDIVSQEEIIKALTKEGLWTMPGGAWCSAGVPIYDKMHKSGDYPTFKHYNFKGEDVTHFANLDCQTPYYFVYFEKNKFNHKVVDFFLEYTQNLQKEYNFDGFRVDHIDHIVDEVSQKGSMPISYRAPYKVLGKMNSNIKKQVPYFATLAEYMLWDGYFKEYHKDMNFDLLWGDDIVSQYIKTPEQIINDNMRLEIYNAKNSKTNPLSILKAYNNQDGEFRDIDQYPSQLGEEGALFKWFKYKFLPAGKLAQRSTLFVDGDESFTKTGIERIIGKEVSMIRNNNWSFWEKFNAINYFAQHSKILSYGKAILHVQSEDGFCCWEVINEKDPKETLFVVANYFAPTEKVTVTDVNGNSRRVNKKGKPVLNKTIKLKDNKKLTAYYDFKLDEMQKCEFREIPLDEEIKGSITFEILQPSEFKVYKLVK